MIVTARLFEAYLECSTKCWLRSRAEPTAGNAYAEWAREQNETYYEDGLNRLLAMRPENDRAIAPPISKYSKDAKWRLAIDVRLQTNDLESRLHAVERIPSEGRGRTAPVCPLSISNSLTNSPKTISCCSRSTRSFLRSGWT